jgi:hypothetical protein
MPEDITSVSSTLQELEKLAQTDINKAIDGYHAIITDGWWF